MTLRQDGWRRVAQGMTTIEEVVRVTQNDEVMTETSLVSGPATRRHPDAGRRRGTLSRW